MLEATQIDQFYIKYGFHRVSVSITQVPKRQKLINPKATI
jgi:hypothetical protein